MHEFATTRGSATIHGTESIADGAPATLLLHAGVADRRSWFQVMELLADKGMRCVAYDQRGYGDTESADEPYRHRDDLAAVLDDRGLDSAILVGASRGGQVALDFTLAMPERVLALMLVGSAPGDAPFPHPPERVAALFREIEEADESGDLEKVNELEARAWLDGPLAQPQRVGSPLRTLFLNMNGRALGAAPTGTPAPFDATWEALPALRQPVSILVGELDNPSLVAAAKATADRIPNARFLVLPQTAHLPMLELPSLIADEVSALAARV